MKLTTTNQNLPVMKQIIALITSKISPEMIVLFGSYARSENTKNSNIDCSEGYIPSAHSRVRALGRSKKVCTLSQIPYQKQQTPLFAARSVDSTHKNV